MTENELFALERMIAHTRQMQMLYVAAEVYCADVEALIAAVRRLKERVAQLGRECGNAAECPLKER